MVRFLTISTLLVLSSCYVPLFDPGLSLAVKMSANMEAQGTFGPIQFDGDYGTLPTTYFLTPAGSNPKQGFLVMKEDTTRYVVRALDKTSGTLVKSPFQSFNPPTVGQVPSFAVAAEPTGPPYKYYLAAYPGENRKEVRLFKYETDFIPFSLMSNPVSLSFSGSFSSDQTKINVIGVSLSKLVGTTVECDVVTYDNGFPGTFFSPFSLFLNSSVATALNGSVSFNTPFNTSNLNGSYVKVENNKYFNYVGTNGVKTLVWTAIDASDIHEIPTQGVLRFALHTGQAVYEDGDVTRIYNFDGSQAFSFSSNYLRLNQEYQELPAATGEWYCQFVLTTPIYTESRIKSMEVGIYRVKTSELYKVAD